MATGIVTPPRTTTPSKADVTLAGLISKATGLNVATVLTWITAENGPATNRLGLMKPGTQTLEVYPTVQAQAQAVSANLHTPTYAAVLSSGSSVADQLDAIAQSRWDIGHYTGGQGSPKPGVAFGTTLRGAAASLGYTLTNGGGGAAANGGSLLGGVGGAIGDVVHAPENAVKGVTGAIGDAASGVEGFIVNESAKALSYVVLTVLGIGLVFFGLLDLLGYSPRRVAGAMTPGPSMAKEDIPF